MDRHRFDALSLVLGLVAIGIGVFVITGAADRTDVNLGAWLAGAALVLGLGLLLGGDRFQDVEVAGLVAGIEGGDQAGDDGADEDEGDRRPGQGETVDD